MESPTPALIALAILVIALIAILRTPNYQSAAAAISRYLWFYKLTPNGRALFYIGCITAAFGGASLGVPVYILLCMFFLLGLSALIVNTAVAPRLEVAGGPPRRATAGEPVVIDLQIRNAGRLPAWDVDADFSVLTNPFYPAGGSGPCTRLEPGSTWRVQRRVVASVRGIYRIPRLRAFSTFPFGIVRGGRGAAISGRSLIVLPRYHPLEEVRLPHGRRYQPGGVAMTSEVGESPEYLGNREYRPGDRIKHIEHRAWARTGRIAVREYREEFYTRVALILDTQMDRKWFRRRKDARRFEAAISLTASISEALSRGEFLVDLFAAGPRLHIFRAGRHTAHLDNILEILAGVSPCTVDPFQEITSDLADEIARTSSVVCVFLRWDEPRRALVELAVDSGCAVKVLLIGDHDVSAIPDIYSPRCCPISEIENGTLGVV